MASNFTLQVTVQVDVQNAENIQQARESVFALLSAPKETKQRKGRPTATLQTKATVTGIQIPVHAGSLSMTLAPEKVEELKELMKNGNHGGSIVAMSVGPVEVTETTP